MTVCLLTASVNTRGQSFGGMHAEGSRGVQANGVIMLLMMTRVATDADRPQVIRTVVAAFASDPAFRYFFADNETYAEKASAFVGYLFDKRIDSTTVWVTADCSAASLWSPPDHLLTDESRQRSNGLERAMNESIGPEAAARLQTYNAVVDDGLPRQPFWYLGILAVHPDAAGRGFGKAVMTAGLDAVRENNGTAILETTNVRNPAYYTRSGWALVNTIETTTPSTIWIMEKAF